MKKPSHKQQVELIRHATNMAWGQAFNRIAEHAIEKKEALQISIKVGDKVLGQINIRPLTEAEEAEIIENAQEV